jgi:hypothetical protein
LEKNLLNPLENEILQMAAGGNSSIGGSAIDERREGTSAAAEEELGYYKGLRFLLLARAYES